MNDARKAAAEIFDITNKMICKNISKKKIIDQIAAIIEEREAEYRKAVDELVKACKMVKEIFTDGVSYNQIMQFNKALAAVEKLQEAKDGK